VNETHQLLVNVNLRTKGLETEAGNVGRQGISHSKRRTLTKPSARTSKSVPRGRVKGSGDVKPGNK